VLAELVDPEDLHVPERLDLVDLCLYLVEEPELGPAIASGGVAEVPG
jgi:hypothetical protein